MFSALPRATDHLVYATRQLATTVAALESELGVRASSGGSHPNLGTCNYLLSLGDEMYLEIIGPDPAQPTPAGPRPFGIDELERARLVTWAIRESDLEGRVALARAGGYDPGAIQPMSRQSPNGLLEWRLAKRSPLRIDDRGKGGDGVVPFLIDWGTTEHPASAAAKGCRLRDLHAEHPDPQRIRDLLGLLAVDLEVRRGAVSRLVAVIETPSGNVTLT